MIGWYFEEPFEGWLLGGMASYLHAVRVLPKNFGAFAEAQVKRLRKASLEAAQRLVRPVVTISKPQISKDETARTMRPARAAITAAERFS